MLNIRLNRFIEMLKGRNLDGALIFNDINRNYITGFTGEESFLVATEKEAFFITDSRYTEQARKEVTGCEIRQYDIRAAEYICNLVKDLGIKRLGFEENHVTFNMYEELSANLQGIELVKLNGLVEKLRQVKDQDEIENIKKAAAIADKAYIYILDFIKPGVPENTIALNLEFHMKSNGASALSFPTIAASGLRSSLPHGRASDKLIEEGDFLTLDFGCIYNGYCSDMTRTVVVGKATERQKEIYNLVLEANEKALQIIKPGLTGESIDAFAREVIANRGFGQYFGHGLGHGVGMEIHELPYISKKGKDPMSAGMVITDEPGIYIPDFGGVRIEELVLVTEDGCSVISKSDKTLIEIS